ncbi:TIGR02206 family membrane protein [Butyricicoccus faecihominis]|uniref:YwaF family protein n=1 Tax=Butyricicoccus faecihominis TaxID=1712515 RepID=UPI00247983A9|nr:TIGR02206 family membrane protein [Butyricicoccus faecihominis]MCQ5131248.1 TIGR02206 family membrane protein [Butyricicoccus faecihominis]
MTEFFVRSYEPSDSAFAFFGAGHFLLVLLAAAGLALLLWMTRRLPREKMWTPVRVAAVLVPVLELSHSVWLYLTGVTEVVQLLPLHLCGVQSLFIPLAVFSGSMALRDFVYATSLLGGVFGILFPAGVADYYPLWSFQTIQTVLLHMLLIYVPLAMVTADLHRPDPHRFPRVLCVFLALVLVVGGVDRIFGENYMFLYAPPAGTPLVWVFHTFGRPVYLLITFLLLAGASFIIHLPFAAHRRAAVSVRHSE